jgi:RHS repeat-associated protein
MINGHRGYRRNILSLLVHCAFSLLILHAATSGVALAQTPHSVTRQCGYPGGPTCPPPPPVTSPWVFGGQVDSITIPAGLHSIDEINSWWAGWVEYSHPGTICSVTPNSLAEQPGEPEFYYFDIETQDAWTESFQIVESPPYGPPCSVTDNSGSARIVKARSAKCPVGTSLIGDPAQSCGPAGTPIPLKQQGLNCLPCKGKTGKGDPVDVSDGNNYKNETDYQGFGDGALKFERFYNSISGYAYATNPNDSVNMTVMGVGWSATYFQYLMPDTATYNGTTYTGVYAYRPDGRVLVFNLYNGSYSPDGDVNDSLVQTSDGGWQYQTADDTIETYNASGQLLSIARRGEAAVTVNYPPGAQSGDLPTSVSDAFGHTLQFAYLVDRFNIQRLASITEPSGKTVQYTYDDYGNLSTVTFQDGSERKYTYGGTFGYALLSITDESGVAYDNWTYTGNDAEVASTQMAGGVGAYTFSYSLSGSQPYVTVVDPLGESRTYDQQLIWGSYYMTSSSGVCPGCNEAKSLTFDADANITSRTDFDGNTTTHTYDPTTNLEISRTEAYGTPQARTITTKWDANWSQPDLITEPGRTIAYSYDAMGNVLTKTTTDTTANTSRTWTYAYDSYGRMLTAEDPRENFTSYTYYTCTSGSQCGELDTATDALGHVTTYNAYDANGRPLTITDPNGTVTTLTYDLRGRLTSRTVGGETTAFSYYPTGLLEQVTLPDGSSLSYTYDPAHRLTQVSDGLGNKIVYTLDAMGNRTAVNAYDPSGALHRTHTRVINALNEVYQEINAAGTSAVTTSFGYDSNGNTTSIDAPLSRNTGETYDALNRVSSITDPANGLTTFGYDAEDDLTSVKDPRGLTTSYGYDGFGDLTAQVSADTGTTTDTYDADGNLATSTDARGAVATYGYDALNRVTSIAYSLSGTTDQTLSFTYDQGTDGIGHLIGASDANHSMSWTYDALGEITGMSQTVGGVSRSVGYAYTNGDLTSLTTPSGQTVTYGYNTNHQVTSIAVNGTTVLSGVSYEPFGPVDAWTWGNGNAFTRTFDGDGDITGISTTGSQESLSYDDASRISGITNTASGSSSWTYGYDSLDRLTGATTSSMTEGWTYDADGNRLSETGASPSTYSIASVSNEITGITGTLTRSYAYDAAGDTLSDSTDTDTYDDAGRLKTISNTSGTTTFIYNALGQMIEASGPSGTTVYVYDQAGHLLGEYDGSGNLIQEMVWLGDIPVATVRPSGSSVAIYYVLTDHLDTPREVIRPSDNTVMWSWFTGPFGAEAPNTNPQGAGTFTYDLRFPGQIAGAWGSTFQNDNRDYDPAVGKYVESDPIGLYGGSYSTYAYASGNPLTHFDPTGLDCLSSNGRTLCAYPGGPIFSIPTPPNFPAYIGPKDPLYHHYDVSVSEECPDDEMIQGLINSPAPGDPMSPATATGTPNVAQALGVNNPIISYVTNDLVTGNQIVVNVTTGTQLQGFSPGYVARTVSNGIVNNYGEGEALVQSPLLFSPQFLLDQYIWRTQTNGVAKKCGCHN